MKKSYGFVILSLVLCGSLASAGQNLFCYEVSPETGVRVKGGTHLRATLQPNPEALDTAIDGKHSKVSIYNFWKQPTNAGLDFENYKVASSEGGQKSHQKSQQTLTFNDVTKLAFYKLVFTKPFLNRNFKDQSATFKANLDPDPTAAEEATSSYDVLLACTSTLK